MKKSKKVTQIEKLLKNLTLRESVEVCFMADDLYKKLCYRAYRETKRRCSSTCTCYFCTPINWKEKP
jgi:hypothetical protein